MKMFLVTGAAGFIGFHLCKQLLDSGHQVVGIDNLNNYYDVSLKEARCKILTDNYPHFNFIKMDITHYQPLNTLFNDVKFDAVFHLAAQVGIPYSLKNPLEYTHSNLVGFTHILEVCRNNKIPHLIFASSSSVYGSTNQSESLEHDPTDSPISFYAATKKANEVMAHSYASLYKLPCTVLRFFTVYGPWGRPDMSPFKFTRNIIEGNPISLYNNGEIWRDFTYVADIVKGITSILNKPAVDRPTPYQVFNIGNNQPVKMKYFVSLIEKITNKKAIINNLPQQSGDVLFTCANIDRLHQATGYKPSTSIETGMEHFINWYTEYYLGTPLSKISTKDFDHA